MVTGSVVQNGPGRACTIKRRYVELDTAWTDANGSFVVDLEVPAEASVTSFDLVFFVNGEQLRVASNNAVWRTNPPTGCTFRLSARTTCLTGPTPPSGDTQVYGSVNVASTGEAVADSVVKVEVYEKTIGGESLLGSVTVTGGDYVVSYVSSPKDLFVRLVRLSPSEVLYTSKLYVQVSGNHKINIEFCHDDFQGDSEYQKVVDAISGLISSLTPVEIAALEAQDYGHLAVRGGRPFEQVLAFITAKRLNSQASNTYSVTLTDGEEVLYGLLRQGLPGNLGRLVRRSKARLQAAIEEASTANVIDTGLYPNAAARAQELKDLAVTISKDTNTPGSLYNILLLEMTASEAQDFVDALSVHSGSVADFWSSVSFSTTTAAAVKELLKIARLCLSYLPMVTEIWSTQGVTSFAELSDWPKSGTSSWNAYVTTHGFPDVIAGATAYEDHLYLGAQQVSPGVSLTRRLADSGGTGAALWLSSNLTFDFESGDVDVAASGESDATKAELKKLQRLYRVVPRDNDLATTISELDSLGYTSAKSMARAGRKRFLEHLSSSSSLDAEVASEIYAMARRQSSMTSALLGAVHPRLLSPSVAFLGGGASSSTYAGYTALFEEDNCECRHCVSVQGPAAYLADLLTWLDDRSSLYTTDVPADSLESRRPDLLKLQLDCDNALTPMPYVDLAIEVMEAAVLAANASSMPAVEDLIPTQTTASAAELLAKPEYRLEATHSGSEADAYSFLSAVQHPRTLPFDYHHELVRTYLSHLGIRLHRLWEDVTVSSGPGAADVAAEALGVSPSSKTALANTTVVDFYDATSTWPFGSTVPVEAFMLNQGLEFDEFLDLANTRFANSSGDLTPTSSGTGCTLDSLELTGAPPSDNTYIAASVLLRLADATGWSVRDVDAALAALGIAGPTVSVGQSWEDLGNLRRLVDETSLEVQEVASWFGDLDTHPDRERDEQVLPLYDRLFLDGSAFEEDDMALFDIHDGSHSWGSETLSSKADYIKAAVRLSASDYETVLLELGTSTALSVAVLSAVFRRASLARVVGLSQSELKNFIDLTGLDPYSTGAEALHFVEAAARLGSFDLTVDDVAYLVGNDLDAADNVAPADSWFDEVLATLQDEISSIDDKVELSQSASRAACQAAVAVHAADDNEVTTLMAIIDGSSTDSETTQKANWGSSLLDPVIDQEDANTALIAAGGSITDLPDRYLWVVNQIEQHEGFTAPGRRAVVEVFAEAMELDTEVLEALQAWDFSGNADVGEENFATVFLDAAFLSSTSAGDDAVRVIYKASRVLRAAGVDAEELDWWLAEVTGTNNTGSLPLTELTQTGTVTGTALVDAYTALEASLRLFQLRERLPGTDPKFSEILSNTDWSTLLTDIETRTGWEDLQTLATGIQLTTLALLVPPAALHRLVDVQELLLKTGTDFSTLSSWVSTSLGATASAAAVRVARGQYDDVSAWSKVARPVRNRLRLRQRDALTTYLIATNADFSDEDDLYAHYLIDPQMDPCMVTSRLKQAISAVQLYIHRAFLGLEEISLDQEDYEEWEWRNRYRLWEAARRVFLYPENWIYPELRGDTTPFFDELVNEVLQNEITDDFASELMLRYLDKLKTVSRLTVLASHHQVSRDATGEVSQDVLHVFARTEAEPRRYFYRSLVDQLTWTPWEEVKLPIKSDQLLPVVIGQRLVLFWLDFQEAEVEEDDDQVGYDYWEVSLSWAEYRKGRWGNSMTSTDNLVTGKRMDRRYYHMNWSGSGRELTITLECSDGYVYGDLQPEQEQIGTFTIDFCTFRVSVTQETVNTLEPTLTARQVIVDYIEEVDPKIPIYGVEVIEGESGEDVGPLLATTVVPTLHRLDALRFQLHDKGSVSLTEVGEATVRVPVAETSFGWYDGATIEEIDLLETGRDRRTYLAASRQYSQFVGQLPFFVQDDLHAWFVTLQTCEDRETLVLDDPSALLQTCDDNVSFNDGQQSSWSGTDLSFRGLGISPGTLTKAASYIDGVTTVGNDSLLSETSAGYRFWAFDHPYVCNFLTEVRLNGVMGLLSPDEDLDSTVASENLSRQRLTDASYFEDDYAPTSAVHPTYPVDEIDFSTRSAYGAYNWEIFFHIPFYIATQLSSRQQYADAQRWFHTIFDPTNTNDTWSAPTRFWKVKPLMEAADVQVDNWATFAGAPSSDEAEDFEEQVAAWEADPFDPHAIAKMRPIAYGRAVIVHYVENLLSWGDHLFRQDTMETVNQAAQLYVLAGEVLGERPEQLERREEPTYKSFAEIQTDLASTTSVLDSLENYSFTSRTLSPRRIGSAPKNLTSGVRSSNTMPSIGGDNYFCILPNDELLKYWDTVEDRLYKIRHCMNIEGVVRALPLFEPPLDPGALVRAVAAGTSLSSVTSDVTATRPHYRFTTLYARALSYAGTVRALGGALLTALEKKDAESLALLRGEHELKMLAAAGDVREMQVEEARWNMKSTQHSLRNAKARAKYYAGLIEKGLLPGEELYQELSDRAQGVADAAASLSTLSSILGAFPETIVGTLSGVQTGGDAFHRVLQALSSAGHAAAARIRFDADKAARAAQDKRREMDWKQQLRTAERDIAQQEAQLEAAEKRLEIAKQEVQNNRLQLDNAQTVSEWMTTKYTNEKLYSWMVAQISKIYFQSYQLAHEMAKLAQVAYQYELGSDASFIQYGHFDSQRKGLLAGERLTQDLERMEASFYANNAREFEITKTVSLAALDGVALELLRKNGVCYFHVDEVLFDLDFPGHFYRRIKSVAVTIPSVDGSFSSVNAKVTLLGSSIRTDTDVSTAYARDVSSGSFYEGDPRFSDSTDNETIAVSRAQQDAGLFQADVRDERYLPFEGRGVISSWMVELPGASSNGLKQFDWDAIGDVVLEIRYTARDGGSDLRDQMVTELETATTGLLNSLATRWTDDDVSGVPGGGMLRVFSAKHDFPDAWHAFLNPDDAATGHTLVLPLTEDHFLKEHSEASIGLDSVEHIWVASSEAPSSWPVLSTTPTPDTTISFSLSVAGGTDVDEEVSVSTSSSSVNSLPSGTASYSAAAVDTLTVTVDSDVVDAFEAVDAAWVDATGTNTHLEPTNFDDLLFIVRYSVS